MVEMVVAAQAANLKEYAKRTKKRQTQDNQRVKSSIGLALIVSATTRRTNPDTKKKTRTSRGTKKFKEEKPCTKVVKTVKRSHTKESAGLAGGRMRK